MSAYHIFVFGGSTTFGYGLPDDQTVPSYLQEELRLRMHRDVRVYNFGAGYYQSTQERILFQELLVKGYRPDMAVFLDGLNDFASRQVPHGAADVSRLLDQDPSRVLISRLVSNLPMTRFARVIQSHFGNSSSSPETDGTVRAPAAAPRGRPGSPTKNSLPCGNAG